MDVSQFFPLFDVLVSFILLGTKTPAYSYSICCVTACKYTLCFPVTALWAQCDPAHTGSSVFHHKKGNVRSLSSTAVSCH